MNERGHAAQWLTSDDVRSDLEGVETSLDEITTSEDDHLTEISRLMDRAATRRGAESVNSRWGNQAARSPAPSSFARATATVSSLGEEAVRGVSSASAARRRCSASAVADYESAFASAPR